MIRRTHEVRLFGAPILKLPFITEKTFTIDFNPVERAIYEAVKKRYIEQINNKSRAGILEKSYRHVLTMLLRLRQLTAHPFMLQETMENLFQIEDIKSLYQKTDTEVTAEDNVAKNMLATMRKIISERDNPIVAAPSIALQPADVTTEEEEANHSSSLFFQVPQVFAISCGEPQMGGS